MSIPEFRDPPVDQSTLSDRSAPPHAARRSEVGAKALVRRPTKDRASNSEGRFLNGKVLSRLLRPCGEKGPAAFPLVRALLVARQGLNL